MPLAAANVSIEVLESINAALVEARALELRLDRGPATRALAIAQTKLEEAEMWTERAAAASEEVARLTLGD